jgi:RND family efflux transporter MFP subunit
MKGFLHGKETGRGMMKRTLMMAFVILLVMVTPCCKKKEQTEGEKSPPIHRVRIETIKRSSMDETYEAVGTVRSKTTTVLSSKIVGNIVAIHVHEGDRVQAGQLLIEIDSRDARAQLQKTQAGLQEVQNALEEIDRSIEAAESARQATEANQVLASTTFARYKVLLERRSVSQQEFDEVSARNKAAEAEVDRGNRVIQSLKARRNQVLDKIQQANADVESAQVYADYFRITSPIQGIVTAKQVDVGFLAAPGVPLLTLEDSSRYRFEAVVQESLIRKIRLGSLVGVTIDALGQRKFDCRVTEVVPTLDPESRTFVVKIDLPEKKEGGKEPSLLRSGLFGKARFSVGRRETLLIPQRSVMQRGELTSVFVVDESGTARLRLIKTGDMRGDRIEVLSGINGGERIIVDDLDSVTDGSRVQGMEG